MRNIRKKPKKTKKKENPAVIHPISCVCKRHSYCLQIEPKHVYDGDTIRNIPIEVWPGLTVETNIRLARIQAPEIRTKDPDEKSAGYRSKQALINILEGETVTLQLLGKGKYGRMIGELYDKNGKSISDIMMESGYARQY